MNYKLDVKLSKTILSLDFIKNLPIDLFENNTINSIYKEILQKISFIKGNFYNIVFIKTRKKSLESFYLAFSKKTIKTFSLKYKGYYKSKHNLAGTTIITLLNNYRTISSYINNTINAIHDTTPIVTTKTYINCLYLQLYLLSKSNLFIIYDIFKRIDLYNYGQEINAELSNETKTTSALDYNKCMKDILIKEITDLQSSIEQVDIIFSPTSKRGYKKFTNSNIQLPSSTIKYYLPTYGTKLKPYYYKYTILSFKDLFSVSIYQIYLFNKVISKCSLVSCSKYFVSKKRKDEHFCNTSCKEKFYQEPLPINNTLRRENQQLIKQIKDFLKKPKFKNGTKIKQEDRLKELEKFENSLASKKQYLSDKALKSWLVKRRNKYLEIFSKKKNK